MSRKAKELSVAALMKMKNDDHGNNFDGGGSGGGQYVDFHYLLLFC